MKCGYCKNEMIKGAIPDAAIEWHQTIGQINCRMTMIKKRISIEDTAF